MALIHSFESSGNFLFKYRGQFPILLFLLCVPYVYATDYTRISIPSQRALLIIGIVFCLLGFLIRAITIGTTPKGTSGRNTEKQVAEQLNTVGIYSVLRHPLYVGNYFMWAGIVVYTMNFSFFMIFSLAYWLYYERIMYAEERFLERKFGQIYVDWSMKVPAFIPSFKLYEKGKVSFSYKAVFRREYSGVLATVIGFVYIQFLRNFFALQKVFISTNFITVLIITIAAALILRSLKHYTGVLKEEEKD
ncbi:MAG TPA: isoprenylcysteine carboxylmethyltransferase family protein [Bacteroidia bacterium]|nr:isoprenylcysteine carboxylmethyltransferase family protein [Bacteroidia bacterium]